jgi:zinc D-Ala-D-Ala carboxypeptidase
MNLSPHFTLAEFTESDTAARLKIDNSLPAVLLDQARGTAAMLERIRATLGALAGHDVPIIVTSCYRCPALNKAIGSSAFSDHPRALAVDFKAPAFGTPYAVCKALVSHVDQLGIGQLIHEFGRWVHVSSRRAAKPANRVITITAAGTRLGIQQA